MSRLLLLSGGKDSAWVALYLSNQGESVTALTIDTGFMAPVALKNARKIAAALGIEHIVLKPDMRPLLRASFLERGPGISTVDFAEGQEIFRIGSECAAAIGARLVCGLSSAQVNMLGDSVESPLAKMRIAERQVSKDTECIGIVTNPLLTNSRLMVPLLVLDVARYGRSSFRPYLTAWYWRLVMPALEFIARNGWLDRKANRVLAELNLSLSELCH